MVQFQMLALVGYFFYSSNYLKSVCKAGFLFCKGGGAMVRADRQGKHRTAFEKNRKRILMTESVCGICGQPVDKKLKPPHPLSPVIDHIIPISKGGHPSDINNLQLAHWQCNRAKSDKLFNAKEPKTEAQATTVIGNRNLPQSMDWLAYRS